MKPKFLVPIVALVVIIAVGIVWLFRPSPSSSVGATTIVSTDSGQTGNTSAPPTNASPSKAPSAQAVDALTAQIDAICAELKASKDPKATRAILAKLRDLLDSLPPEVASWGIQAFLSSHHDAATNLNVTVKPGGKLGDSSSLRVFLLDYLGQVDRPAAGAVAMEILAQYTTPDEWGREHA